MTSDGDITSLDNVDVTTPFYCPFQFSTIRTGIQDTPCDGAPNSGILIQTPNEVLPVEISINGVKMQLAATILVQAQPGGVMTINVLDGFIEIEVGGAQQFVPAGAKSTVQLGEDSEAIGAATSPVPYMVGELQGLPINNLTHRFDLPKPLSQDEIDALVAEHFALPPTPIPTVILNPDTCRRFMRRNDNLYAGPGLFYEIVTSIDEGRSLEPVYQAFDPDGKVWWQLRSGSWVRLSSVEITGQCEEVPVTNYIPAPSYNELKMESCETSNRPLREGQWVEIEFVPPAFGMLWLLFNLPLAAQAQTDLTCADIAPAGALPTYYLGLGDGYFSQGNYTPALVAYTCAIESDPTYAPAYMKRGYAYAAQRNTPQALSDYNMALELNAELVSAYNNRGLLYTSQGNFGLAITDFTLAVTLDPNYAIAYNNRGLVHAAEGNYDLALADIQQAIALDANYAEAHASLGAVYLALAHESYETYGEIAGANAYPPGGDAEIMLESLEYSLPNQNFSVWLPLMTPGR